MKFSSSKKWALAATAAFLAIGAVAPGAMAADHRDSFAVDAIPEGDFTDVFAYVDPENNNNVILSFMVNSFANPGLNRSYRFAPDLLYQMKINNNMANGAAEDLVLQVQFGANSRTGIQDYRAILGVPNSVGVRNSRITSGTVVCSAAIATNLDSGTFLTNPGGRVEGGSTATGLTNGNLRVGNGAPNTSNWPATQPLWPQSQPELAGLPGVGTPQTGLSRDKATYEVSIPTPQGNRLGKCFAGTADDSFQTDVAQAVFRQGLNSSQSWNNQDHTQELFRGFAATGSLLSGLRGRPVRLDGTSGVDGFGGFSGNAVAISIPKSLLQGTGIPDVSQGGAINPQLIGVWGTVSRPTEEAFDGWTTTEGTGGGPEEFAQFERMGQQIAATTFMFQQPIRNFPFPNGGGYPLSVAEWNAAGVNGPTVPGATTRYTSVPENKDLYNATNVTEDVRLFSRFYPDSLTTVSIGLPTGAGLIGGVGGLLNTLLGGNTTRGRGALLTLLGFNSFGLNGVSLFPVSVGLRNNSNRRLQSELGNPDYMRLNLNVATDGVRPGAATSGNTSKTLGLYKWGLQNGRRPSDDVTDIVLRITREVADVSLPTDLVLPGLPLGTVVPGSQTADVTTGRHAVNCNELQILGSAQGPLLGLLGGVGNLLNNLLVPGASDGLLGRLSVNVLHPCEDARVFVVLQGTDFIEPLSHLDSVADQYSADNNTLLPTFPYFGDNAVHGQPGSPNYGPQD